VITGHLSLTGAEVELAVGPERNRPVAVDLVEPVRAFREFCPPSGAAWAGMNLLSRRHWYFRISAIDETRLAATMGFPPGPWFVDRSKLSRPSPQ